MTIWRYQAGERLLQAWKLEHGVDWNALSEEQQDFALADFVLDMRDEHVPLQRVVEAVAGCRKAFAGRRRF
eukprot:4949976-Lingulodinium_polyedra.AAC.1